MIKKELIKSKNQVKLTFVLPSSEVATKVAVLGDFNGWNPKANPLVKRTNGTLSSSITVPVGERIRFRYYGVDGHWFNDNAADDYEVGEFGTENCVVLS